MSLVWRKLFRIKDGEKIVGRYRLMLRNAATRLAYLCNLCPCVEWNISMLCPCNICGTHDTAGLGENAVFPEFYPTGGGEHPKALGRMWDDETPRRLVHAITIQNGLWPPRSSENGDPQDPSVYGVFGQYISAVRYYFTSEADFAATVTFELMLDGTTIKKLGPISVGANEEYGWIGRSELYDLFEPDDSDVFESDTWLVNTEIMSAGDHALYLRITYDGGADPLVRTVRTPIQIHLTEGPNLRDVLIVPAKLNHADCLYPTSDVGIVMASLEKLKGPFRTKEDAEQVYSMYGDLFEAKAKKCLCLPAGCSSHSIGYGFFGAYNPALGLYPLEQFSGLNVQPGAGCDYHYIEYSISMGANIRLIKIDADGNWSRAGSSGILAPCEHVYGYSTSVPGPEVPPGWDGTEWEMSGDQGYVARPVGDCPFCDDPNDPEAPEYCIYSNAEWEAIPNNSDELEELLGGDP